MSQLREIAAVIRQRFATQIATPLSLQVAYDNAPFTPPASGRWCRLAVLLGAQAQVEIGMPRFRTVGVAIAQLFDPVGQGDGAQLDVVDAIVDAFRSVSIAGPPHIAFQPPYVSAPPIRDDAWWTVAVTIPFRADEFPT